MVCCYNIYLMQYKVQVLLNGLSDPCFAFDKDPARIESSDHLTKLYFTTQAILVDKQLTTALTS